MKKILFLGGLNPGGAEHQMVLLASLLKKDGYEVTYLCDGNSSFFQKYLDEACVPIIRIRNNKITSLLKLNIPRVTFLLRRILKNGKYDTVVSFLSFWNYANCKFAKGKATQHKAITGLRNNRDNVFLSRRFKRYAKYEKYADVKVCNSNNAKNVFANYYPEYTDKLTTIYNIVELPEISSKYTIRDKGKTHIIVPASYREVKNPMGLLKALALMNNTDKALIQIDWYGNIEGGKACYENMLKFIHKEGLENVVNLFDATTDIANRINEADVVGLFSSSEGLPNSICEGMMLGKPVVMTRVSDCDVMVDQTNGLLCDWDNPKSIKDVLVKITELSEDDLVMMGKCSKSKALSLFAVENVLEQWKKII